MTSWVQSDGPHVAYADANGNVYQLWYTVGTGQWAAQNLMTVPNSVPVGPGRPMTSWVQSDGPHLACRRKWECLPVVVHGEHRTVGCAKPDDRAEYGTRRRSGGVRVLRRRKRDLQL